jgi:hypothetical protein
MTAQTPTKAKRNTEAEEEDEAEFYFVKVNLPQENSDEEYYVKRSRNASKTKAPGSAKTKPINKSVRVQSPPTKPINKTVRVQ